MSRFGFFLAGGVIGAAAAWLCTPGNGKENRTLVAEKVNAVWGDAQNIGANAGGTAQQVVSSVTTQAQAVAGKASARVQEVASNLKPASESSDELREKIKAARQRIANQVAKNAGEASSSPVEAVVEQVEDVEAPAEASVEDVKEVVAEAAEEAEKAE